MEINSTTVATDNDFINHLVETRIPQETILNTIKTVLFELGYTAIIHPLVYKHEVLHDNKRIKAFFDEKIIQKVEFDDIFQNNTAKKMYYIMLVEELFKTLKNGQLLPVSDEEILTFWCRKQSLGEIHSLAMCLCCGCDVFLSDDDDSKKLAKIIKAKFPNSITVYNRKEVFAKHLTEGKTPINRKIRNHLTHIKE